MVSDTGHMIVPQAFRARARARLDTARYALVVVVGGVADVAVGGWVVETHPRRLHHKERLRHICHTNELQNYQTFAPFWR